MFGRAAFIMDEAAICGRDTRGRSRERKWRSPFLLPLLPQDASRNAARIERRESGTQQVYIRVSKNGPRGLISVFHSGPISSLLFQHYRAFRNYRYRFFLEHNFGRVDLLHFVPFFSWSVECRFEKKKKKIHPSSEHTFFPYVYGSESWKNCSSRIFVYIKIWKLLCAEIIKCNDKVMTVISSFLQGDNVLFCSALLSRN